MGAGSINRCFGCPMFYQKYIYRCYCRCASGLCLLTTSIYCTHHPITHDINIDYDIARPATTLDVNVRISVGDGEPIESALRRFKREVNKSGHLMDLRHRRHFENSQEKKKRKVKEGRMRAKFERMQRRRMAKRT